MRNYFSLNSIGLIAIFFFSFSANAVPLTGTKTIGGTSPDYATFADAVTDLNTNGVGTGGITFNLRSGSYAGNVTITATGTLASPIVFQSENLDATTVIISNGGSADVITLQGASYLIFRALTIDYTANLGYSAIEITENCDFLTLTDCILDGSSSASQTFATSTVYASETQAINDCESFVVSNCTLRNGSYGIYFAMSTVQPSGIVIENNFFENSYAGALQLQNLTAPVVTQNTITTTQTGNGSYRGIYLNNCDGKSITTRNYIYSSGSGYVGYGIYLQGSNSTQGNNALIANNSVQITNGGSICIGIDQSNNSTFQDIFSNTIFVSGGTSASTYAYRSFTFSDDTKIKNNIFANFAAGTGNSANQIVYIGNLTGVSEASNNCYWTANTGYPFRVRYGISDYTSLTDYATAIGETNAMNFDPLMQFISGTGWKATSDSLMGAGLNLAETPNDIDGSTRFNPTTIGAHENTISPPANDNRCDATTLSFGTTPYTTLAATTEVNEPVTSIADCATGWCAADVAVQKSVWFTFTLAQTKKVRITTTGFDTQIALYSAASCSTAFSLIAANDNAGSAAEITSACLSAGTYFLQVDGFQGASGSGNIVFTELTIAAPAAQAATSVGCSEFAANWSAVAGAVNYFIDIATDNAFANFVAGYNNYNAGNFISLNVTSGLQQGTNYYYRVRTSDGCISSANSAVISLLTLSLPEANFSFAINGFAVSFSNSSSAAVSYQWNFGDGNTSINANLAHTYSTLGNYTVQLIATNSCGSDTVSQNVNLNCNPISVSIIANSRTTFCTGDSVELTTTPVSGYSYQWLNDAQLINGAESFEYTVLQSGNYSLSTTDSNSCFGNSNTITVIVNDLPVVLLAAFDTVCTTDQIFNLSGGSPFGGTYFVDGFVMFPFDPGSGSGVYQVEYFYVDTNGCAASASENLIVEVCIGVENIPNEFIHIAPNPASDFLTITFLEGSLKEPVEIILYDAQGKIALHILLENGEETLRVNQLDAGVYLVKILSESKVLFQGKVSVLR